MRHPAPLLVLLATAALSTPPLGAQAPAIRVPYTLDTLANGLALIVHEDHSAPIVTVNLWHHVGSGDEKPGRTGFAHLFEHLMFTGSEHAEYPAFDRLLEAAGADNNGSTNSDRTNYYEWGPANAWPLMLWLESDRMGWFLPVMTQEKLDVQRDVVKNERRQRYENQPYGLAYIRLRELTYPASHPYHWPPIGYMEDLTAASLEDTKDFFRNFYGPGNASLVVAGDVKTADVRKLATAYFGDIPRGPAVDRQTEPPPISLARDTVDMMEDRVQLPRLYYQWHTARLYHPDDAPLELLSDILTGAKNSRLTQRLVYEMQIATSVVSYQDGKRLDGDFTVYATARPGHALPELQSVFDDELAKLAAEGPTARELEQAQNGREAAFLDQLEQVNDKADQLNSYYYFAGVPDWFARDLARYRSVTRTDIQRVAREYLMKPKVVLSVVPQGRRELAAPAAGVTQ